MPHDTKLDYAMSMFDVISSLVYPEDKDSFALARGMA